MTVGSVEGAAELYIGCDLILRIEYNQRVSIDVY